MINIKSILLKEINDKLKKFNILNKINIQIKSNNKFSHYQICGLLSILKITNIIKFKLLINNILVRFKKYKFINKIYLINNNFINIKLKHSWIEKQLRKILLSNRLNISLHNPKNIIIDYSSPNMSKVMHIGHLRSAILGDSCYRISSFLGHNVIKINHIGDWGLNFGMIISIIKKYNFDNYIKNFSVKKLEYLYIKSKKMYENNKNFKIKTYYYFKKLLKKDKYINFIWKKIINSTLKYNQKVYKILNIKLNKNDILGESFYQDILPYIIKDLKYKNIAIEKNGLTIVPLKKFKNKDGKEMGVILKKENEIYLYSAIEIASIRYRCKYLFADKIIYYTDIRQKDHLIQSLEISKIAKYIEKDTKFEHHYFGMILNKNNLPFKTRDGKSIKLMSLINKCLLKTKEFIFNKNKFLNKKEINILSKIIGIGSLKYIDLSKNRLTNYIMDIDNMFSLKENNLIYIYYSYIRITSILEKINIFKISKIKFFKYPYIKLTNKEENNISLLIIKFEEIIQNVFDFGNYNTLCLYIYELSLNFTELYNKYIIIKNNKLNINKINLLLIISKIIKKGLHFLGIKIPKKM